MKPDEIANLNKEELFLQIKEKCKSRSRTNFYGGIIFLVAIIAIMAYAGLTSYPLDVNDIIFLVLNALLACMGVWLVLYSYRFSKKIDSLETPDQLLYNFEKHIRNGRIISVVCGLALIISQICYVYLGNGGNIDYGRFFTLIVLAVAFILLFNYLHMSSGTVRGKDKEIIERLHELIENE